MRSQANLSCVDLACLRGLPAAEVERAFVELLGGRINPVVDGHLITDFPLKLYRSGAVRTHAARVTEHMSCRERRDRQVADVPVIIGYNRVEGNAFLYTLHIEPGRNISNATLYQARARRSCSGLATWCS